MFWRKDIGRMRIAAHCGGDDERTRTIRHKILDVLEKDLKWRSRKFIPKDPCDVLFSGPQRDPCAIAEALMPVEDLFSVKLDPDNLKTMTLGELVDLLRASGAVPSRGA